MAKYPRYAIYYAPEPGSGLHRFGASMLGYDAHDGRNVAFPDGVPADWRDLTEDPRKYGFHATLKAPMTLVEGASETDLIAACLAFAETPRAIPLIEPVVTSISGFVAIVPAQLSPDLQKLASDAVEAFDSFRAPLTPEDRARRKPDKLTAAQRDYLDRWGYPYVFDEFRFHLTLTCRIDQERRDDIVAIARQCFAHTGVTQLPIDRIDLFRQDSAESRFKLIRLFSLTTQVTMHS